MPTKNFLSSETKETLQQALKDHEHPDIRQRALIFLLLNNGNTQAQTAAAFELQRGRRNTFMQNLSENLFHWRRYWNR